MYQKPKACVVTFGCQQNESDSEKIKGILSSHGYDIIAEPSAGNSTLRTARNRSEYIENSPFKDCSLIIINTCAVREHAELKALSRTGQLKHFKEANKDILIGVCGCVVEQPYAADKLAKSFSYVDFMFGTKSLYRLPEIIIKAKQGGNKLFLDTDNVPENLPVLRENPFKAYVSVMYGCDNFCSYCVVPYVRGRERSRGKAMILDEVRGLIDSNYREITLLGQNVNSYNGNGEDSFTGLLESIVNLPGDFRVRFMTSHPKDVPDSLIDLIGSTDKIAKHFHLPAQSGSDSVLSAMNRRYTRDYYLGRLAKLRESAPDIAVTSDIIVGFPAESSADFEDTLTLIEEARFDGIFSFIYSKRKGTPAESMADITSKEEKSERFARLIKTQDKISEAINKSYIGKTERVLVESDTTARTSGNKSVTISGGEAYIGSFCEARITDANLRGLFGEITADINDI
ncbi:tRNA-2-methylthio-N(6)-dimethylallyladenosine synthase [Clostridia bacterium]|nr:tRNA-2-methylthio-N(6)-dimethylallyladenosine synthase [Clostridia bacterium]